MRGNVGVVIIVVVASLAIGVAAYLAGASGGANKRAARDRGTRSGAVDGIAAGRKLAPEASYARGVAVGYRQAYATGYKLAYARASK